ncbi:hypothetical protein V5T82_05120 [Magnetovibrio sp. PR-2]|uniref:hypothetical protein n=1 Tax=Magnetovibrio sp. PR-2 TaxID=3120356 RepID=UPI002FCE0E84
MNQILKVEGDNRHLSDRRQCHSRRLADDRREDPLLLDAERRRLGDRRSSEDRRSGRDRRLEG